MTAGGASHHIHHIDIVVATVGISGIVSQGDPLEAVDPAKLLRNPAPPADHESLPRPRPCSKEKGPPSSFTLGTSRRASTRRWPVPPPAAAAGAEEAYPFLGLQGPALEVAYRRIPPRGETCRSRSSLGRTRSAPAASPRTTVCPL